MAMVAEIVAVDRATELEDNKNLIREVVDGCLLLPVFFTRKQSEHL